MMKKNPVRRYAGFCVASFIMALGIALVTNANLGTTPITSLPFALAAIFSLSLGAATFLLNVLFVAAQKCLLRQEFSVSHLLQLPAVLPFSAFIDLCMWLTQPLTTSVYPLQLALCLTGCVVLGLGVSLEIVSDATVLPGEGIVIAIAYRSRRIFGNIKVLFDLSLVLAAAGLSFAVLHAVVGLREGTVIAAVLTGFCVRFFSRWTRRLGPFFHGGKSIRHGKGRA
ncbi:YczE/YyaS/YitT family protein [Desulfovibrio sp. SGI.169]